jgi:hypothetical protein
MANREHLTILRQGAEAWNKWRLENPEISPYLVEANLIRDDLSHFNLNEASLSNANLSDANLSNANLSRAILSHADLSFADLSHADLSEANLSEANLSHADLIGANLTKAKLLATVLGAVDLSKVKGLESANHIGPSTIGIDTILRSNGKIPKSFLRGAGVPDIFIKYAASLAGQPLEFYSCFISYSSKDDDLAQRLYADLQAKGVRCWFAPEDLKIGDRFRIEIDRAIRVHDKLLILLSANSVSSDWVEKEVETAFEHERRDKRTILFPIRLDDAIRTAEEGWAADIRRQRHIGDFTKWKDHDAYQKAFDRLLRDLKAAKAPPPASAKA